MSTRPHRHRVTANGPRRMDQRDLADRWDLSVRTLERWRSRGEGPPYLKLGGRIVYCIEDIEAFEAAQRRQTKVA